MPAASRSPAATGPGDAPLGEPGGASGAAAAAGDAERRTLFTGVGAAKSGTTWLAERLGRHPEIFMSPIKEMHWFDAPPRKGIFERQLVARARAALDRIEGGQALSSREAAVLKRLAMRDDSDYLRYFLGECESRHRAFGEFTPSYALIGPAGFGRIRALHARTRFIFMMRNPIDRFWSHAKFRAKRGGTDPPLRLGDVRLGSGPPPGVRARGDYVATLDALAAVVPAGELFTLFYEDLFDPERHGAVLGALWEFLGVTQQATGPGELEQRVNVTATSEPSLEERRRVFPLVADSYHGVADRCGRLPESWRRDLERFS